MPSCPAPSKLFGSSTDCFRNVHSRTPGELRGHSRFRRWRLLLTWTHIGFMIVSITASLRWTKIHKHGCSCFPMSLKQSNSSNAFVLVSSRTCVFQGGIKMHDRNSLLCRLPAPIAVNVSWKRAGNTFSLRLPLIAPDGSRRSEDQPWLLQQGPGPAGRVPASPGTRRKECPEDAFCRFAWEYRHA